MIVACRRPHDFQELSVLKNPALLPSPKVIMELPTSVTVRDFPGGSRVESMCWNIAEDDP